MIENVKAYSAEEKDFKWSVVETTKTLLDGKLQATNTRTVLEQLPKKLARSIVDFLNSNDDKIKLAQMVVASYRAANNTDF